MNRHNLQNLLKKVDVQGIVGIEMFESDNESFFDRYLNEVLYLFEQSGADVIVFEDLDRYDVTLIFEKLREISELLYQREKTNNSAGQSKKKAPRFFYLIRDDIFSSSDRSKFFDLIIPVVPVASTENTYEHLNRRLEAAGFRNSFKTQFLRTVSLYISDLRLIHNIVNEYALYDAKLGKLERDPEHLMAIIVYKNLFPKDYNALLRGEGYVYNLFRKKKDIIREKHNSIVGEIEKIDQRIDAAQRENLKCIEELNALFLPYQGEFTAIDGTRYYIDDRIELVNKILSAKSVQYRDNKGNQNLSVADIIKELENNKEYMDRKTAIEDREPDQINQLQDIKKALERQRQLLDTSKLHELISNIDDSVLWQSGVKSESGVVVESCEKITEDKYFPLLKYFLRNGYIDENYGIYISYFYPGSLTANDKNFLLAVGDHKSFGYDYKLDSPKMVLEWLDKSYFTHSSISNYSLFEYVLEQNDQENLEIWMQALDSSNSVDDQRFDFLLSLLETTRHRASLIVTINERMPHWLHIWTTNRLLKGEAWRQFVLDSLYCSETQVLLAMNDGNWLSSAISDDKKFLQIDEPDIERLIHSLQWIDVQFTEIEYRQKDLPLVEQIYKNNIYSVTMPMIEILLTEFYGMSKHDALFKSYSCLRANPDTPLSRRVETEMSQFVKAILSANDIRFCDDVESATTILNCEDVDDELKENYIRRMNTILPFLKDIEYLGLWPTLLECGCVEFSWKNVADYYLECCDASKPLDNFLTLYLKVGNGKLTCTQDELAEYMQDKTDSFLRNLIECGDLPVSCYKNAISGLNVQIKNFESKNISDEHFDALLECNAIKVMSSNVEFVRESYPQKYIDFVVNDGGVQFASLVEQESDLLYETDLIKMLEDDRLNPQISLKLLELFGEPLSIKERKFSDEITIEIINDYFLEDDIEWMLENFDDQSERVQDVVKDYAHKNLNSILRVAYATGKMPLSLYATCLDCMAEDDAKDLRAYLENKDYESVCTGERNPKFPVTQENSIILEYYKEKGWISSYKQISNEEYQAYAKHKSTTTV